MTKKWPKGFWTEVTSREFVRSWKVYMEEFEGTLERKDEGKITGPQTSYFDGIPLFRVTNMTNMKRDGYYINSEHVDMLLELAERKLGPLKKVLAEVIDFQEFLDIKYK